MIDALASETTATAESRSRTSLAGNFDTFLALLTTQLENQDPLSPMEAEKFTEQLVQFTSVEQQIETNSQLSLLVGMMKDAETTAALDYLGKEVVVAGSSLHLDSEGSTGGTYRLPADADSVTIEISTESGLLVRRLDAEKSAGSHQFEWDGQTSNGDRLPSGVYRIDVKAADAEENPIDVEILTGGTVTGIESGDDGMSLLVNGIVTPLSAIRSISQGNDA